ncbi:MAG TPA: two-component sensor histidine kinase, partial [Cupriavidus sp.]|nr:two-component sensor histidine kinase [Cupriavidus sp.]
YRVESSRSRATGGVGMGLAIAADIVARHGGELTLTNRTEGGLRVRIVLPRA